MNTERIFHSIILMVLFIFSTFINTYRIDAQTTHININNGNVNIKGNAVINKIEIYQNSLLVDAVDYQDVIEISSNNGSPSNNYIEIDINNINQDVQLKLNNLDIDTTNIYYSALEVKGTSPTPINVNIDFEGQNTLKSDGKYLGNLSNGISSKAATNASLKFNGTGVLKASGYDCGIYVKNGDFIIENGEVSAVSSYDINTSFGNGLYANNGNIKINGGLLKTEGKANGLYSTKTVEINSGVVNSIGNVNRGCFAGKELIVNGGQTSCLGSNIGIQVNASGANYNTITINGGTIEAKATSSSKDWSVYGKRTLINGGSVIGAFSNDSAKRVNSLNEDVYLNVLSFENYNAHSIVESCTIDNIACNTIGATGPIYGINDVYTDNSGKVYFYLKDSNNTKIRAAIASNYYQNVFSRQNGSIETLYKDRSLTFEYKDTNGNKQTVFDIPYNEAFNGIVPSISKIEGYTFDGWYYDDGTKFNTGKIINTNTLVRAKYTPIMLTLKATSLPHGKENEKYNYILPIAQGGVPQLKYTLTGLPNGLTFNADTRTISGKPQKAGKYKLIYSVKDSHKPQQEVKVTLYLEITKTKSDIPSTGNGDIILLLTFSTIVTLTTFYYRKRQS